MQTINLDGFIADQFADTPQPEWNSYTDGTAVVFPNDLNPAILVPHLTNLRLIVVPFDHSADGRGFSIAAQLRDLGFAGHMRARGHILVDQFRAALRCGFDDIQIPLTQVQRNPAPQWRAVAHTPGYLPRIFDNSQVRA